MPKILLDYEKLDYPYEPDTVRLPNGSDIDTCAGELVGSSLHLVLYRGTLDDIPVKVFASHEGAKAYAKEVALHYAGDVSWEAPHHPDVEKQIQKLGVDVSTFIAILVFTVPLGVYHV